MIRCKYCKQEILLNGQREWIHSESCLYLCDNQNNNAEPEKFCTSCNEPQIDKEVCGCGYKYDIREV